MESVDFEIMTADGRVRESGTLPVTVETPPPVQWQPTPDSSPIWVGCRRVIFDKPITIQDGETLTLIHNDAP